MKVKYYTAKGEQKFKEFHTAKSAKHYLKKIGVSVFYVEGDDGSYIKHHIGGA